MDKQLPCNNHQPGAEVFITSFLEVVYSLKNLSNACLSNLDNGLCDWNFVREQTICLSEFVDRCFIYYSVV